MNRVIKTTARIIYCFLILMLTRSCYAMPTQQQVSEYNYHTSDQHIDSILHKLGNNKAVILRGSSSENPQRRITIGNYKVAKRNRSSSITNERLHLHHILFKGIRQTFPGIPYLCIQTPKDHHDLYHDDRTKTDIKYNNFSNMRDYLLDLRTSITIISLNKNDLYSNICTKAARYTTKAQIYWIAQRYSWLYTVENGKYLLLAQRLIAKDCFPNQILANKHLCQTHEEHISKELALSRFTLSKISISNPGIHLINILQSRINNLELYTIQNINLTSNIFIELANQRYRDSERFFNPLSHIHELSGEWLSDASSLD